MSELNSSYLSLGITENLIHIMMEEMVVIQVKFTHQALTILR